MMDGLFKKTTFFGSRFSPALRGLALFQILLLASGLSNAIDGPDVFTLEYRNCIATYQGICGSEWCGYRACIKNQMAGPQVMDRYQRHDVITIEGDSRFEIAGIPACSSHLQAYKVCSDRYVRDRQEQRRNKQYLDSMSFEKWLASPQKNSAASISKCKSLCEKKYAECLNDRPLVVKSCQKAGGGGPCHTMEIPGQVCSNSYASSWCEKDPGYTSKVNKLVEEFFRKMEYSKSIYLVTDKGHAAEAQAQERRRKYTEEWENDLRMLNDSVCQAYCANQPDGQRGIGVLQGVSPYQCQCVAGRTSISPASPPRNDYPSWNTSPRGRPSGVMD